MPPCEALLEEEISMRGSVVLFEYDDGNCKQRDTAGTGRGADVAEQLEQDLLEVVCRRGPTVPLVEMKRDWRNPGSGCWKEWGRWWCGHLHTDDVSVHGGFGRWMALVDDGAAREAYGAPNWYTPVRWYFLPTTGRHM